MMPSGEIGMRSLIRNKKATSKAIFIGAVTIFVVFSIIGCLLVVKDGVAETADESPSPSPTETPPVDYAVVSSAGPGGTISPEGSQFAYPGWGCTFTITPDSGYVIADVVVDDHSVGAVSTYEFHDVQTSHHIDASFALASVTPAPIEAPFFSTPYFAVAATVIIAVVIVVVVLLMRSRSRGPPSPPTA